jgi:hypothetical protein
MASLGRQDPPVLPAMPVRHAVLLTPSRSLHPSTFHSPHTLPGSVDRNSFVCHSYENCQGHIFQTKRFSLSLLCASYPLSFDNVPNSFALAKNSTLFFSSKSKLFCENTRGVGGHISQAIRLSIQGSFSPRNFFHPWFSTAYKLQISQPLFFIFMQIGGGYTPDCRGIDPAKEVCLVALR